MNLHGVFIKMAFLVLLCLPFTGMAMASSSASYELGKIQGLSMQIKRLWAAGRYADAIPLAHQMLSLLEKVLGSEHPDVAAYMEKVAGLHQTIGDYAGAATLSQRALAIREKVLNPDHRDVAASLNNLAMIYQSMGDYAKAEPLYRRAIGIVEKTLPRDDSTIATGINNLAMLYQKMGDYAKAEPLLQRALAIREKVLDPDHPDLAGSLNNLALLYQYMGDYAKAEPLYQRALAISEKIHGPEALSLATNLHNLASLYTDMGRYAKAEPLHRRALAIREKVLGLEHPDVAVSLNDLALHYAFMGDYAKAEPLYRRAIAIKKKIFGGENDSVAINIGNLATIETAQENYQEAFDLYLQALAIDRKTIDQVMGFTSEKQKLSFLAKRQGNLNGFFSLVVNHLPHDPKAQRAAFDTWISRKGVVLEAQSRFQEALAYSDDPTVMKVFHQLARVRAQLSRSVFAGADRSDTAADRQRIAALEKEKQQLEAKLSRLSQAYARQKKIDMADSRKIAAALPDGTVLLDFARVDLFDFNARGEWLPARYVVFALHAGSGEQLAMIDLGEADLIDKSISRLKRQIKDGKDLSEGGGRMKKSARHLYRLVFAPVIQALGGAKEIFVSPDGNLNLISFEVLQCPDGRFLIENYTFNYLAASRDLLGFGQIAEKPGKSLIIGDPDFDMGADASAETNQPSPRPTTARRSVQMSGMRFSRLPGTEKEVKAIRDLLGKSNAVLCMDRAATEDALFSHPAPRILHLATHGFFLNDQDLSVLADKSGMAAMPSLYGANAQNVLIENPLLRSGIALAGANAALMSATRKSDGIVTAEKILGFRLRGTRMVVLSACQTGEGQVQSGEGVFGLRRAFVQAGTQSLVMSMWSVPDQETQELMVHFYRNLATGLRRSQALRQAALEQMQITGQRYGYAHPFYWGAFVFLGESCDTYSSTQDPNPITPPAQ